MSATQALAQFIVDTSYEKLRAPVVEAAKIAMLLGLGLLMTEWALVSTRFRRIP